MPGVVISDRWFGGGRFWQIPSGLVEDGQPIVEAMRALLNLSGLPAARLWAVEHVYSIYNRRFEALQLIPVFAAELADPVSAKLSWEHAESGWFTVEECHERLAFRGLHEGLDWTRHYISEVASPRPEFLLG
jgi:hypothetical protein